MINPDKIPSICEDAPGETVTVTAGPWTKHKGDQTGISGCVSIDEINLLPQGQCNQAELPDGCPFVAACTGKVRFEKINGQGVIFLALTNSSAVKRQRTYGM